MKLDQMFPKLMNLKPSERLLIIINMRKQREIDLIDYREGKKVAKRKSKKQSAKETIPLNFEQKSVMKMLGLTAKDLKGLKNG
jgi:hypothetical protein